MAASRFDACHEALKDLSADAVCARLGLQPLDGGGHFDDSEDGRLILLGVGDILPWQKWTTDVEAVFYAGAPLALSLSPDGHSGEAVHLGTVLPHHRAQAPVAANHWMTAESLGIWSLMCLNGIDPKQVSELAPPDWYPTPKPSTHGAA